MFKKLLLLLLVLIGLSFYGFAVHHITIGGQRLGFLTKPVKNFALLPKEAYHTFFGPPKEPLYYKKTNENTKNALNLLKVNLYGLGGFLDLEKEQWQIKLFNFKDDKVLHEWQIPISNISNQQQQKKEKARPLLPILLPDYQIITQFSECNELMRLNKKSEIVWRNTERNFHHGMNLDAEGNIWVCGTEKRGVRPINHNNDKFFRDETIVNIDIETGKILFEKSLSQIFIENGQIGFVYGATNNVGGVLNTTDPIHLNDVQPALADTEYWNKGDLFISMRHRSAILLYRPSENKIIKIISGPFLYQHDVDIISDKEIALFNNNYTDIGNDYTKAGKPLPTNEKEIAKKIDSIGFSEILIYNFEEDTYRPILTKQFQKENLFTKTQGCYTFLESGKIFIESQNDGVLYLMTEEEILLKKWFPAPIEGYIELPNWIRIYESIEL